MPRKASSTSAAPAATAASNRPKRASAVAAKPALTTTKTSKSSAAALTSATKKRGRPAKASTDAGEPPKKRGRPAKSATVNGEELVTTAEVEAAEEEGNPAPAKKSTAPSKPKPAVGGDEHAPPKKRGRPPKGGETTKVSRDDVAAAEQLREELVDTTEDVAADPEPSKLSSPPVIVKTAASKKSEDAKKESGKEAASEADALEGEKSGAGKRYFLMKAEQEDRFETLKSGRAFNTKFTIDDLRGKSEPEMWDGVRNAVARNVMKEMKKGDMAFFYASGGKGGKKPGITGIVEIVAEAEPDPTTHDEDAIGYVEKESDRDKWVIVKVEFRKKLHTPVTLDTLKKHAGDAGKLAKLQVLNAARLSVSRVAADEWDFIVDHLITDGYEE